MKKNKKFIPVCEPYLKGNEKKYLIDIINSGWISSSGGYIQKFEEKFSNYCGMKYGISCTSGTSALHLALLSLGIQKGDEIIIPDFTMVSTLFAILYCKARPVFVDVEKDTWNIDVKKIEEKITKKTKAIIPVHIYGHSVNMDPVLKLAKKHKLFVIEDAAEAHGAEYKGKKCGSFGDINCFSFYANKIITCGEGGMVITSNKSLADKVNYYKNLCFPLSGERSYFHKDLGYNYRMTNMQAGVGLAQLERINDYIKMRRKNAKLYNKLLKGIPGIECPIEKKYAKNVYWMYGIVINPKKFGINRDKLIEILRKRNIDTRLFFQPMHRQEVLKKLGIIDQGKYPITEYLAKNGFYLPSSSGLKKEQIQYICEQIRNIQKRRK